MIPVLLVATALQRLAIVALSIGGTHIFGSQEFGKFALAYAFCVNVAAVFVDSLSATASVYIGRETSAVKAEGFAGSLIRASFLASGALALSLFLGAKAISGAIGHPQIADVYRISAFLLFFMIPAGVMSACLYALNLGRVAAMWASALAIASVVLGLAGGVTLGAMGICAVLAITSAVTCGVYFLRLPKHVRVPVFSLPHPLPLREFVLPTGATMLLTTPVHLICLNVLASGFDGLHQTALFSACFLVCAFFTFIPGALNYIVVPHFSKLSSEERGLLRAGRTALLSVFVIGGLFMIVVIAAAPWAISIFGNDFRDGANTLRLLSAVGLTSAMLVIINQLLWASSQTKLNFLISAAYAACYILTTIYLVRFRGQGAEGLAAALLIAQLIQLCIYAALYGRGIVRSRSGQKGRF